MWQVVNETPFAVDQDWTRDRNGAEVWLVVVKATFNFRPDGSTAVSEVQLPVTREPVYHDGPAGASLRYETDMVPRKTRTDVLVVGHAHAPGRQPATQIDAGFSVGPVRKLLRVTGDRQWGEFGATSPQPFLKMPLSYERAFGGIDLRSTMPERDWEWRNPVGRGFAASRSNAKGLYLPNIEYPAEPVSSWRDRPAPAGFGPVACHWQPRASLAGTYDAAWEESRKPLVPEDMADEYYQCAPGDQQSAGFLRGGESVTLHNLTPGGGSSHFTLPRIHLGFETRFSDGSSQLHQWRFLHSVIFEPDESSVSLVWHSALPCHSKVYKLAETLVTAKTNLGRDRRPFVKTIPEVI